MSDPVPPEQPTGEVTPLRSKPAEPENGPASFNPAPPWQRLRCLATNCHPLSDA